MENGYFSGWLPKFVHHLRMRNYSPRTIQSYSQTIRNFAHFVWLYQTGDLSQIYERWHNRTTIHLDTSVDVSPRVVEDFLAILTYDRPYRPSTLQRIISSLSSFYRYLVMQGAISRNPLEGVDRPRLKDRELRYLKHNQVIDLIESVPDERDRLVIRTIYATGVRVSELCSIQVQDIDFSDHTIRIRGKGGKFRTVFIDDETLAAIRRYLRDRKEGPLFPGQQGRPISPRTVQHIFSRYAPPGITPHTIRHSYASELYRRSKNLRVVQENLGHSSIRTTEVYLHTDLEERKRVYNRYFPLAGEQNQEE
ncbi:MAG: site-specific tyrosine recombinase/integron integrase [Methanoculleaceae archaeon]